jgi:hypothetical protein
LIWTKSGRHAEDARLDVKWGRGEGTSAPYPRSPIRKFVVGEKNTQDYGGKEEDYVSTLHLAK